MDSDLASESCEISSSATAIDTPRREKQKRKIISVQPPPPIILTAKQRAFCHEFVKDLNATQAAIRAGYSEKAAAVQGSENLRKPNVSAYCKQLVDQRLKSLDMDADEVLRGIADIALHGTNEANRLTAYELLGKYFNLWGDQFGANENIGGQVVFYMPEKGR